MAASRSAKGWLRHAAKLVTGTGEHTIDLHGDPFSSDVEEDKATIQHE